MPIAPSTYFRHKAQQVDPAQRSVRAQRDDGLRVEIQRVWDANHQVRFCRYADDGVIHCQSEAQARLVLRKLGERLGVCGLELHPEKTRIVHCHDVNRQAAHPTIQFTFLGYTFRPRKAVDKYGRIYVNFSPGVSREALRTTAPCFGAGPIATVGSIRQR